jgi:hypothetical protein
MKPNFRILLGVFILTDSHTVTVHSLVSDLDRL